MSVEAINAAIQQLSESDQRQLVEWLEHEIPLSDIDSKIAAGLRQLDDGEGIPGDVSRSRLQERKTAWLEREQTRT